MEAEGRSLIRYGDDDDDIVDASNVPLPDEAMEEGELSDEARRPEMPMLSGRKHRMQISISDPKLPDLLQEIGDGDVIDRQSTERLEARAKRFNIQTPAQHIHYDDILKLYDSLGIPKSEYESGLDVSYRQYRLEAIHVYVDSKAVLSDHIIEYFKDHDFAPVGVEPCDAKSFNVIWKLGTSAANALLTMSRPIAVPSDTMEDEVDEEMVLVKKADEYDSEKENSDDPDMDPRIDQDQRSEMKLRDKLLKKFDSGNQPISIAEIGIKFDPSRDFSRWRIGRPSQKLGNLIYMNIATRSDLSDLGIGGASKKLDVSHRHLVHSGGLMSSSKKRRLQEEAVMEKAAAEEYEVSKRYSGPVGKNPWGSIAEDWSQGRGGGRKDFANELEDFAKIIQGKKSVQRDITDRLGPKKRRRDWDAPEEETVTEFVLKKGDDSFSKRHRSGSPDAEDDQDADSESEDADDWGKKLKRPRMAMIADEIGSQKSAKVRVMQSIKRRVPNRQRRLKQTDDEEEVEDLRQRIPGRGLSMSLRDRLGDRPRRTFDFQKDDVDPLEQDTGEDLGQIEGTAANMVIQVPQSPRRRRHDEEMEVDDSHVASVVSKIKTEKGEEERKNRRRERQEHERQEREQREREERREVERRRERREEERRVERQRRDKPNRETRSGPSAKSNHNSRPVLPIKIKKEKTDDEKRLRRRRQTPSSSSSSDSSTDSSDSDSSSSDSSSDESSTSSSDSSSSDSSSSSNDTRRKRPSTSKSGSKSRPRSGAKSSTSRSSKSGKSSGDNKLTDKLQDYLKKSKERQRKDKK